MKIRQLPDPSVVAKMKAGARTNILVIGGGLTSAQVADMAIRRGVTKVWHLIRGPLKGKRYNSCMRKNLYQPDISETLRRRSELDGEIQEPRKVDILVSR